MHGTAGKARWHVPGPGLGSICHNRVGYGRAIRTECREHRFQPGGGEDDGFQYRTCAAEQFHRQLQISLPGLVPRNSEEYALGSRARFCCAGVDQD